MQFVKLHHLSQVQTLTPFLRLGCDFVLEKEMAIHSSIVAWRIPWMEEPGGLRQILFSWAPKSLQTVTEAMKLKDVCSLEDKP